MSDEQLVRLARDWPDTARGQRAMSTLLKRYRRAVYGWCRKHLRDSELAMDAAQEVLLSAWRNLAGLGDEARFSSWLFAIARNRCLSMTRRPSLLTDGDEELAQVADPTASPARQAERCDDERKLWRTLGDHLSAREQEAIWLQCIEGFSVEEITEVLQIDGSTGARSVLQNARRKLRAALGRPQDKEEGTGHA